MDKLLYIHNGERVHRSAIPHLSFHEFRSELLDFTEAGGQIVQFFAYDENNKENQGKGSLKLLAVLRNESNDKLCVTGCDAPDSFDSLTAVTEKFHMFERELGEQYGLKAESHPWWKMVRYQQNCTGKPDVFGNNYSENIPGNYPYFAVEGEGVHEVAVGPVHAGIIEPGHFRFQCFGERVFHLEIQLGYQHRGVEHLLQTVPMKRLPIIGETISGDTSIGHGLCMAQGIESLADLEVDEGSKVVRTLALELERIANHIGDLGALSLDVAFSPPAAYFGRIRGEYLNLSQILGGNRFGRGLIRPGGVTKVMGEEQRQLIQEKMTELTPEVEHVNDLIFSTPSVRGRFDHTGTVSRENAEKIGLVGYAGRACGLPYDARVKFPTECYGDLPGNSNNKTDGDVASRAEVRREEIMHSIHLVNTLLARSEEANSYTPQKTELAPDSFVVTVNEAWRGEASHCILTDAQGKILRYKVKDPSFHNWTGLALSLREQGISDFPLCNKSFNLSYCGFDL
ncbi:MAG: hydrogenase [Candidatus Electrothrix communis]|nr:MAG: hydrogenase [Candidatus Electrothrix communis]